MKPLRTVSFFGTSHPTAFDLLQARGGIWLHLTHGNWNILVGEMDGLRPVVEHLCAGRLYTLCSHRSLLRADRVITISRPDIAQVAIRKGRETWFYDDTQRIIPRPFQWDIPLKTEFPESAIATSLLIWPPALVPAHPTHKRD